MLPVLDLTQLAQDIKRWGLELGFQQVGISDTDLSQHENDFKQWLANNYHGEMTWLLRNQALRLHPEKLHPNTLRVISVRMNYLPPQARLAATLKKGEVAYISRYALGRDYHTLMRKRLKNLAEKIKAHCGELNFRPFVDSAPILERPLAAKAGLGWVGKHSLILNQHAGSWFFLGELLVDIPLPIDTPQVEKCQHCVACIKICPTNAIVAPYVVDARRCISYLTIEFAGVIPEALRPLMGNRIYGCDDCQMICPWNRFSQLTSETDFMPRAWLQEQGLLTLYAWDEETFLRLTEGSAIRRIGYERWLRNITIALGNAPYASEIESALLNKLGRTALLDEHIHWAIAQQQARKQAGQNRINNKQQRLIRTVEKGLPRDA